MADGAGRDGEDAGLFLEALKGALEAEMPSDVATFVHRYCRQRMDVQKWPRAEQVTMLFEAAAHGKLADLEWLVEQGLDPETSDYDRRTPLHLAAEELHLDCVRFLIDSQADVNAVDRWGTTPLAGVEALIVMGEDEARGGPVAALLRSAGGSFHAEYIEDGDGTPMGGRPSGQHGVAADFVIGEHTVVGEADHMSLRRAAADNSLADIRKMLNEGRATVNSLNCDGRSALHVASEKGHLGIVKFLVERQADVNCKDNFGNTPLSGAERNSHFKVANFLKDMGAKHPMNDPPKTLGHSANRARKWWDERLCREAHVAAGSDTVPVQALRTVLERDFGFNLGLHKVLDNEIMQLEREVEGETGDHIFRSDFMKVALSSCPMPNVSSRLTPTHASSKRSLGGVRWSRSKESLTPLPFRHLPSASSMGDFEINEELGHSLLSHVVLGKLAIGNWASFVQIVRGVYDRVLHEESLSSGPSAGKNADYIAELRDAPSDRLAIAICTVDGQMCAFGDSEEHFSVQSTGKSFAYTLAMKQHTKAHDPDFEGPEGAAYVHQFVGQEPSGRAFNDFALTRPDAKGKEHPFNPVTNAGAIVTCSMIDEKNILPVIPGDSCSARMESRMGKYKDFLSDLCGGEQLGDCMDIYLSEQSEAFNNYALANFMRARGTFPPTVRTHDDLRESVDFYLRVCSVRVSARLLSTAAATYATFGRCPLTGQSPMSQSEAKQTLAILSSCGMYDFSGEWSCTVGLPAKSGVSGNIFIVVPGMLGICVWSPRLDALGNSVRGIRMAQLLKDHLSCSLLDLLARHRA